MRGGFLRGLGQPQQNAAGGNEVSHIARAYFAGQGREIDVIKLNGSIELAPILGLSDVIVDLVETGKTLAENGLAVLETISPISARLVANKASLSFRGKEIEALRAGLEGVVEAK